MSIATPDNGSEEPSPIVPPRRTDLGGPAIEQPLIDVATNEEFLGMARQSKSELGEAVRIMEATNACIIRGINELFNSKLTKGGANKVLDQITDHASNHALTYGPLYMNLQESERGNDDETSLAIATIFKQHLEAVNEGCEKLTRGCDECDSITYSLEGLKEDMCDILSDPDNVDIAKSRGVAKEDIIAHRLQVMIAEIISLEVVRIVLHAPKVEDRQESTRVQDVLKAAADIGKVAVGTAIGASLALILANRFKSK